MWRRPRLCSFPGTETELKNRHEVLRNNGRHGALSKETAQLKFLTGQRTETLFQFCSYRILLNSKLRFNEYIKINLMHKTKLSVK